MVVDLLARDACDPNESDLLDSGCSRINAAAVITYDRFSISRDITTQWEILKFQGIFLPEKSEAGGVNLIFS